MKKLAILVAAACLLLAGCLSAGTDPTGGPGAQATTTVPAPTTTEPVPTTTDPVPTTTVPTPTTEPVDPEIAKYQTLLGWKDDVRNPYNFALGCEFSNPKEVNLRYFFDGGLEGKHTPTDEEKAALKQHVGEEWVNAADWYRLTKDKMEVDMQKYFGISLTDLPDTAFDRLMYLESTDCYYFLATGSMFDYITVTVKDVNNNDDGTVSVTYTYGFDPYINTRIVTLKPNGEDYLILSNERNAIDDPVIANPELEAFNELFKLVLSPTERNPYALTTGYEYASPSEIKLRNFFDHGFPGEHEKTADEYEGLKKLVNHIEWLDNADFNRLPKDKMEAELQAVYGISLADLPDSAYEGLYYLESTDCYYMLQTAPNSGLIDLPFLAIEHNEDGTISLTYENSMERFIITLKPNGDSYLVLSNVKAE